MSCWSCFGCLENWYMQTCRAGEKEDALVLMREAYARELQEISELQAQLDMMILEQERREKSYMDDLHHWGLQIQDCIQICFRFDSLIWYRRLRLQMKTTGSGWDTYITQIFKENVAMDTELHSAGEREAKVRAELERCKEDIGRLLLSWERRSESYRTQSEIRHYVEPNRH